MIEPEKKNPILTIFSVRDVVAVFWVSGHIANGFLFVLTLVTGLAVFPGSVLSGDHQPVVFENSELTIVSRGNRHHFRIEVASSRAARMRGLMERRHMDADAGMLFDFVRPMQINMWMKNTFIPLDMLFIDSSGRITGIAANTTPFSTDVIASPEGVQAVLELNAGTASLLNISVGDRVEHDIFQTR
jgi:hypothetical protein